MQLSLQAELLAMQSEDQALLQTLIDNGELKEDRYHPEMKAVHEKNSARMKVIIDMFGWPTISLVGRDASKAAWLIVQHAILDEVFMSQCLALLQDAINNHDAEPWCFAYLQDRVLTSMGKTQIYGTKFDIQKWQGCPVSIR